MTVHFFLSMVFLSSFAAFAAIPNTTHHVTTTKATTTTRHTPEPFEFANNFYMYDRDNHYFCLSHHTIRTHVHYCLCYHVPMEDRYEIENPLTLLKLEKRMFEFFDAGYRTQLPMTELLYYSRRNFNMCTHTNANPGTNTTLYFVYPKPDEYHSSS
uniref:Uncharacterized protein LOC111103851 n=1 Tax=Crassostrea virginica TaxID=6565 RepID=A0A8B8ASD0_CRAVI|nr:uncharacterized protein LOC111103851 [Crassostrea virginica]